MSLLVDRGADMDSETDDGETSLHLASEEHHNDIIQLFLDYSADANYLDRGGLINAQIKIDAGHLCS